MPIKTAIDLARVQIDAVWAMQEVVAGFAATPALLRTAPKATPTGPKGVMTLPGFTAPEASLAPMNRFLKRLGYQTIGWGEGQNKGPQRDDPFEYLAEMGLRVGQRIMDLADETGGKVALVGQSMGGVYARELAMLMPDYVDRIITLGSPTSLHPDKAHHTNYFVQRIMQRMTGKTVVDYAADARFFEREDQIPPVPFVAIYSPYDQVVGQDSASIDGDVMRRGSNAPRENIEVIASHSGMAYNPLILLAIADRLAQDPENWTAFDVTDYAPGPVKPVVKAWFPQSVGYALPAN